MSVSRGSQMTYLGLVFLPSTVHHFYAGVSVSCKRTALDHGISVSSNSKVGLRSTWNTFQ